MDNFESFVSPIFADLAFPGPPQGRWTAANWERLPSDGNRYEVISGTLYMTGAPPPFHQWIVSHLVKNLGYPGEQRGLGYFAFAPTGVVLSMRDALKPDFVFVRADRAHLIQEGRIYGVPDLIIEVISSPNRGYLEQIKRDSYAVAGVPEFAIVDAERQCLTLYQQTDFGEYDEALTYSGATSVPFACLPGLPLHVGSLFSAVRPAFQHLAV